MIRVITFDLWDTVFIDDSDEPKRKRAGRLPKKEERRALVLQYAGKYKALSPELVNAVYDASDAAFNKVWKGLYVTWKVVERLEIILKGLGVELPAGERNDLVRRHEEMEVEYRPDIAPGVREALETLHKDYRLAVVSDAIFTPGRGLRKILEAEGLLKYFDYFVFSDEAGHSKPHPAVFEAVWKHFGTQPEEMLHIGDREHNDILGPKKLGCHALLCTTVLDRGSDKTQADAVFSDYKELPAIIKSLKMK